MRSIRPLLEAMEDRRLPAIFLVTTVADAGPGSLRRAILDSDPSPGQANTFDFAVAPLIELSGAGAVGLTLTAGGSVILGLAINGFAVGAYLAGAGGATRARPSAPSIAPSINSSRGATLTSATSTSWAGRTSTT